MTEYVLRIRTADKDIYDLIASGQKKVEMRPATEKYKDIKKGDSIKFVCGKNTTSKNVINATIFKDVDELFKRYQVKTVFPDLNTMDEAKESLQRFPGYDEEIKKHGLVAWELMLYQG